MANGTLSKKDAELRKIEQDRRLSMAMHDEPPKYTDMKLEDSPNSSRLAVSQPILADISKDTSTPIAGEVQHFNRSSYGSGIMNRSDVFLRSSIHSIKKQS